MCLRQKGAHTNCVIKCEKQRKSGEKQKCSGATIRDSDKSADVKNQRKLSIKLQNDLFKYKRYIEEK